MTGKKIAVIIIIIAVAAAAVFAFFFLGKGTGTATGDAVYVQPVSMFTGDYASTERFSGIVETQKTDKTEFDSDRKLDKLFVEVGDIVKEGDDLFSYDTESIRLEIEQARLEIDKMNMNIDSSNQEINSLNASLEKASYEDQPEYLANIKQLQSEIAQAQYDIKSKESEINRKQAAINESVVKARMGGIVEKIADAQDIIDGKSFTDDGTPDNTFILIRAEGDFRVKGRADEQSIIRLSQGMDVIVRSRIDDKTWSGTISVIDTQSTDKSGDDDYYYGGDSESASNYAFYVELDSTENILLGQHVIIEPGNADTEKKTGIWLSSGFLTEEDGTSFVWAAKDENALLEKRTVTTGDYDEISDTVKILSGLSEKDLIAWPDAGCKEGVPVTTEYQVSDEETDDSDYSDETDDSDYSDEAGDLDYLNDIDYSDFLDKM